eukprot:scaffold113650_cov43-Prasinocladus_malaysianus.AAC.2
MLKSQINLDIKSCRLRICGEDEETSEPRSAVSLLVRYLLESWLRYTVECDVLLRRQQGSPVQPARQTNASWLIGERELLIAALLMSSLLRLLTIERSVSICWLKPITHCWASDLQSVCTRCIHISSDGTQTLTLKAYIAVEKLKGVFTSLASAINASRKPEAP